MTARRTAGPWKLALVVVAATALAGAPAMAQDGHGGGHDAAQTEGHGGGHGDEHAAEGEGGHGGGHGHVLFGADDDHDGTANWLDSDSEGYVASSVAFHFINFLLLLGILVWGAGGTVRDSLRDRALGIRKEIDDAARLRQEATERHEALLARLNALQNEVEAFKAEAREEAVREEERLVERARNEARLIGETAERNIRDEAARARTALRRDAVELAVELARGILEKQVSDGDHRRLAKDFLDAIEHDGVNGNV